MSMMWKLGICPTGSSNELKVLIAIALGVVKDSKDGVAEPSNSGIDKPWARFAAVACGITQTILLFVRTVVFLVDDNEL